MSESNRQKKFGKLVQRELSEILQREVLLTGNPMMTVTIVRGTPDLKIARVYISVFPDNLAGEAMKELETKKREVRHLLGNRLRQQLRFMPEIQFYLDDTQQEVSHLDTLFTRMNKRGDEEE